MAALANTSSIPAPVGGLNDRDSLMNMPAKDAVVLENWWPQPSKVVIRKGMLAWSTGYASPVETIFEYAPTSGTNKIFAIAGTSIFNATAQGAVGAAVVTGLSNARWQDASITTAGGSFHYIVNGTNDPRLYDGTTFTAINAASTPAITGVTTNLLIHVELFKNRLFFTEINSLRCWYLPVNSVGGAASQIDLGSVFRLGGYLVGAFTQTIDAGNGADDRMAFVTSNGEVAVFQGTDPSSASTWGLIGLYRIGRPIGRRCAVKYGGDLLIICEEGVFPLSQALLSSVLSRESAVTDKIQNTISLAVASYKNTFGWQLTIFNEQNMLILNIPGSPNFQYVQNTITGAWAKFTGWTANCWRNAASGLYFGTSNSVQKAWQTNIDQVGTTNNYIVADALPAFSTFRMPAVNKQFTMVRPYLGSDGSPSVLYGLNLNYIQTPPTGVLSFNNFPAGMIWGSMIWGTMTWGGGIVPMANWQTVGGIASSASLRLKVQNNFSTVEWYANDYMYKKGGAL